MVNFRLLAIFALAYSVATAAHSEQEFFDSFESGDISATNEHNFRWAKNNGTSIVTNDFAVYNNGAIHDRIGSAQNWSPKHGQHSLRFRYPAGEMWVQQNFNLGSAYRDIWFRYWVRVPVNYTHGKTRPNNHKFFALWMDKYSIKGEGGSVYWNFWRDSDGGSSITVSSNRGNYSTTGSQIQRKKFIKVPEDRGRWMQVVFNIVASSSVDSSDGYIAFWRRWEGEREFTQMHEVTNVKLPTPSGSPNGFIKGYLMGWANGGYAADTEWLIDDFEVATHSLLNTSKFFAPNTPILQIDRP